MVIAILVLILAMFGSLAAVIVLSEWIEKAPRREQWREDMARATAARQARAQRYLADKYRVPEPDHGTTVTWGRPIKEVEP